MRQVLNLGPRPALFFLKSLLKNSVPQTSDPEACATILIRRCIAVLDGAPSRAWRFSCEGLPICHTVGKGYLIPEACLQAFPSLFEKGSVLLVYPAG